MGLKLPITMKYVDSLITYDEANQMNIMPAGIHIPLKANVLSETGVDVYRYATSVRKNQKGQDVFGPSSYDLNKSSLLTKKDSELVYFLWNFSPFLQGGLNQGPRPTIQFENLEKEAVEANQRNSMRAKVEYLIYSMDNEEQLRGIAYSYHMNDVSSSGIELLKRRIIQFVTARGKEEDYEHLLNIIEAPENFEEHKLIALAFEKKIIIADNKKRAYLWYMEDGSTQIIDKSLGRTLSEKDFFNQFKNNRTRLNEILSQIKLEIEARY